MLKRCGLCVFPFSLALHLLPHLLCLWHACMFRVLFFPQCYVMINLPLGTWRSPAPQRIWRTLCAIPACLDFSPTYKMGICILIPLWPLSETVSQLFASLIPGYCLEEESHHISLNRNQADVAILRRIVFIFNISYHSVSNCVRLALLYMSVFMCVSMSVYPQTDRKKIKIVTIFQTSVSHRAQLVRDQEKQCSLRQIMTIWRNQRENKCCSVWQQYVCAPACCVMCLRQHTTHRWFGKHRHIKATTFHISIYLLVQAQAAAKMA